MTKKGLIWTIVVWAILTPFSFFGDVKRKTGFNSQFQNKYI